METLALGSDRLAARLASATLDSGTALSSAELAVAELAARGFSNGVIASRRCSSPRTVANQLASAYRKLGVSGRRELRVKLTTSSIAGAPREPQPLPAWVDALPEAWTPASAAAHVFGGLACLGSVVERLLAGRWSVIEQATRAGHEYYLLSVNPDATARAYALSAREWQIMRMTSCGLANKVVAAALGISASSVATYLGRAREKLGVERAERLIAHVTPRTEA